MKYANVSVKFPETLDDEIETLVADTDLYTNKSEFVKEACRSHLRELRQDPAVAALRMERLLDRAESSSLTDDEVSARLDQFAASVDSDAVETAVSEARAETAESVSDES
jgi:Arc/MetJ-type ribon-helix-helix transcriptional regulator